MAHETRPMIPTDGWPISHLNAGSAAFTHLMASPGPNLSWYIDGFVLTGGGDGEGFALVRRGALQFAATNNTFTVTDNAALEPDDKDFAIAFGIKAKASAVSVAKILHKDDGADDGYIVATDANGKLTVTVGDGANKATITSINPINDDVWHWVMINAEAGKAKGLQMYIDGFVTPSQVAAGDLTAVGAITGGATALTIVGEADKTFAISALALYKDHVLTSAERGALWANGAGSKFVGTETGLTAAWNLDEGTGTSHADLVWSNDGTSSGTSWLDGEGMPLDPHTLGKTIAFNAGVVDTAGGLPNTTVTFPHSIKIGRNNPIRIDETGGGFGLMLFGHADRY